MKCAGCTNPADYACSLCGRPICWGHARQMPVWAASARKFELKPCCAPPCESHWWVILEKGSR